MPQALSKTCSKCRRFLPLTEFYKDKRAPGGICYVCKDCYAVRKYGKTRKTNVATSLDGLLLAASLRSSKNFFSVHDARRAVGIYIKAKQLNKPMKEAYAESKMPQAFASFNLLLAELKKAGKEGMTLEEYFGKNRPYSLAYRNKQVIAKRGKNG